GPLHDPFAVAATVRHLFELHARIREIEEGLDATHGATEVLLAPLCLTGTEHRYLPWLAYRLHQLRDEAFHLRRRASAVVRPGAEQVQVVSRIGAGGGQLVDAGLDPDDRMSARPAALAHQPRHVAGVAAEGGEGD